MSNDNQKYVEKWRKNKGNSRYNSLYNVLIEKYGVPSNQAQKMKFWGRKRIIFYLAENGYDLLDPYFLINELWE